MRAAKCSSWTIGILSLLSWGLAFAETPAPIQKFLAQHCTDCHSGDEPAGDRNFETLDLTTNTSTVRAALQEIADQLELGSMPPADGSELSNSRRKEASALLSKILSEKRRTMARTKPSATLRRLSRREYRNTVSELLDIDMTMFDPTTDFPADQLIDGFDNNTTALTTSGFLLEKYLQAADACVEKAFANLEDVTPIEWNFLPPFQAQDELQNRFHKVYGENHEMILYDNPNSDPSFAAYGVLDRLSNGVPVDGMYEIRVRATALNRDTPFATPGTFHIDLAEPYRLGIRPGDTKSEDLYHSLPIEPLLAEHVLVDNQTRWYPFRIPLSAGFTPRFTFENGQHDVRGALLSRIRARNADAVPETIQNSPNFSERFLWSLRNGKIPQIRIAEVRMRGPLPRDNSNQPESPRRLLETTEFLKTEQIERPIAQFASTAFRRPITKEELAQLIRFYDLQREHGNSSHEAYKATLKNILCRPEFLYLRSEDTEAVPLDAYAIAERLSYFLSSSMPDEELSTRASQGRLSQPEERAQEAGRLLQSPTRTRFVNDFLDNWLDLRSLGSMPPDTKTYQIYYQRSLESAMREETRRFFSDMLDRNASATEFLTATHSFVNRGLATLYGIDSAISPRKANDFARVTFTDGVRGGLLGQASVLTVSANGIETSPVVRGVWLLDKVLGISSPPPPADVPALDPDVRNATSVRDLLEKHRSSASCNRCHYKIDPLGFAWEEFDPIGQHRRFYGTGKHKTTIDSSGTLPWGDTFLNFRQFRKQLEAKKTFFVRNLTSKLLTHALGRTLQPDDRGAVDAIMSAAAANDYPIRTLIVEIVKSDLFLR